jgi:release factor glutamine methyltransferase
MTKDEKWLLEEKYGGIASAAFEADKARLALGEPVAYLIGWQPFLGLKIYLDSKPLIPRTETEWWVEQLIAKVGSSFDEAPQRDRREDGAVFQQKNRVLRETAPDLRVLDLCAGSGAIGCALLAAFPTAQVSFGEIDAAHEATIRKNIRENGLDEPHADIRIGDLFAPFAGDPPAGGFDLITINPPYIPERRELPASVTDYEPALALFSGGDGLDLMRRIALQLREHLNPGGTAWIECDSPSVEETSGLFAAQGFAAKVMPDQFGQPRVIVIS